MICICILASKCDVEGSKRRPEFTFISRSKKVAIRYWRTRSNIDDDKLDVLTDNSSDINVIYIVDSSNGGIDGQYPETLMKLQERQGYCLFLYIEESDYSKAELSAVFYEKDIDGLWIENEFIKERLSGVDYIDSQLCFNSKPISSLLEDAKERFTERQIAEKERRLQELRLKEEQNKKIFEEQEKRRQEQERQRKEMERRRQELEEKRHLEAEKIEEEKRQREADFKRNMESGFAQQETQVLDEEGNRWIKCEFCGKIAKENDFTTYGGMGHINLGTCRDCSSNNPEVRKKVEVRQNILPQRKYDPSVCPDCGGKLQERSGQYGRFYGCTNYPRCRYSRSLINK